MTISNYYFEPTQQAMSSYQVSLNIGSEVLTWSPERQMELGLYAAFYTTVPTYGIYEQKVDGYTWVKDSSGFCQYEPGYTAPYYYQQWNIVDLTSGEQEALTIQAEELVAQEIEVRLASINSWASSKYVVNTSWPVPQSVKDYINTLLALNSPSNANYPFVLADGVYLRTFTGWPTRLTALEIQQLVDPT